MSEKTKPEELTKEQLERVSGGFDIEQVLNVAQPVKPPVVGFNPIDGDA
jgi:hypothetical protein